MRKTSAELLAMVESETKKTFPNPLVIKNAVVSAAHLIDQHEQEIKDLKLKVEALQTALNAQS